MSLYTEFSSSLLFGLHEHLKGHDSVAVHRLPAFEMSEAKLDRFIAAIRVVRLKMLFGYPSALSHIARHALKRGMVLDDLGLKVACVTSERLYDDQRSIVTKGFACPVANGHAGHDAGLKLRLGDSVQEVIDGVDAIQVEKSGQFRHIVSHVAGAAPA